MAVASDLPDLENRKEYQDARNSVLYDSQGQHARRPDQQPEPRARALRGHLVRTCATRSSPSRTGASTRTRASTSAASAARSSRTCSAARRSQGGSTIAQQFVKNALRAQSDRTVFQKMREAALAYHLTRKWPKSKILTAVPELDLLRQRRLRRRVGGAHLLRQPARPQGLRHARRPLCVEGAQARGGRAASPASSPTRRPTTRSPTRRRPRRGATSCSRTCSTRACSPPREYRDARIEALPAPIDIKPPTVRTQAPYFTTWVRQQLVDQLRRPAGVRGRAEGARRRSTSTSRRRPSRRSTSTWPTRRARRPRVVAIDNKTGEVRAMVGGRDYADAPVQPRHPGPAPAGLVDQAVHPRRGAASRASAPGSLWPSRKRVFTVPGTSGKREVRRQQLREQVRGHADARRRR